MNVQVTEDTVSVQRLAVEGVVDIALDIQRIPKKTHEYVVSTLIQNTLTHKYQVYLLNFPFQLCSSITIVYYSIE